MRYREFQALLLVLLTLLGAMASVDAWARPRFAQAPRVETQRSAPLVGADSAAAAVRRSTGGRVLSVDLSPNGRPTYRVKVLLPGGRVRSVRVDARSGRVLD